MKITIKENQSLLDIACQTIGTAEAVFAFAMLNGLSITEDVFSNDVFEVPNASIKKNEISGYFSEKNIELATGFPLIEVASYGIAEMIIENNFIIR